MLQNAIRSWIADERHGPLPILLLVLTMVTGLVDAVSYLQLGHVFVANMTGNVAFLGFALGGAAGFSITASLVAVGAFLGGALLGGAIGTRIGAHRGRLFAVATYVMIALVGVALILILVAPDPQGAFARYGLIVLLALSMGLQNATARRLGVPDLTTTVLTLTLTGVAADSVLAGGKGANLVRRWVATIIMFVGAGVGAFLIFHIGTAAVITLVLVLLCINGVVGYRFSSSPASWTAAP